MPGRPFHAEKIASLTLSRDELYSAGQRIVANKYKINSYVITKTFRNPFFCYHSEEFHRLFEKLRLFLKLCVKRVSQLKNIYQMLSFHLTSLFSYLERIMIFRKHTKKLKTDIHKKKFIYYF